MVSDYSFLSITEEHFNTRIDRWVRVMIPGITQVGIEKMLRKKDITVNGHAVKSNYRLQLHDQVRLLIIRSQAVISKKVKRDCISLRPYVIYKDQDIIAINKPAGLAVQGGTRVKVSVDDSLADLQFEYQERPKLVHRLDRETSGVLILARKPQVSRDLFVLFSTKKINKTYYALVECQPSNRYGTINHSIDYSSNGKLITRQAITEYCVEQKYHDFSLVRVHPLTGRKHQIRRHLSMIGCPIVHDRKYGSGRKYKQLQYNCLFLHAYNIAFTYNDRQININANLPKHFSHMCI